MLVFGTRPEAIKMAPVYRALRADPVAFETVCCVTAQHRHLLDQVLGTFEITPDIDLDLMRNRQDLVDMKAAVLQAMRTVLIQVQPDLVLVHGDTTTSMASALAAFYAGIAVGHVEAGLRSCDLSAPFPEEFNRRATGMIAKYHFAPTERNKANLTAEGHDARSIVVTGNTVVDALNYFGDRAKSDHSHRAQIAACLDTTLKFDWRNDRLIVVTCHRRENFAAGLASICAALDQLATAFPEVHFVCPVHPNPSVSAPVRALLAGRRNVHLIEPLPYDAFLFLLRACYFVLTDSGGLQEEGPALGKPVLVMRSVTERPEAVESGGVKLVGADQAGIVDGASRLLTDQRAYRLMCAAPNPYGDGMASERIADFLRFRLAASDNRGGAGTSIPSTTLSTAGAAR